MNSFPIPIALFVFNRSDLARRIMLRIREVRPERLYVLSDGPRNQSEERLVNQTRKEIEGLIDWDCSLIRVYREKNVGVFTNLTQGIDTVLARERSAIFLEDDNLPVMSFFPFVEEMLNRYEEEERVLWVCGTNYLEDARKLTKESYFFTSNLQPCGWATWSSKFQKYYDPELADLECTDWSALTKTYQRRALFRQQYFNWRKTKHLLQNNRREASWDHQMSYALRKYSLFGIVPTLNQIENIGVDERSTHGGNSRIKPMTNRFTRMKALSMSGPLIHPKEIVRDKRIERKIEGIILMPWYLRTIILVLRQIKIISGISEFKSFKL